MAGFLKPAKICALATEVHVASDRTKNRANTPNVRNRFMWPAYARSCENRASRARLPHGRLENSIRGIPRLGSARLGSARLGSARLGSARLGSARLGSARLGSARLGSARLGNYTVGALFGMSSGNSHQQQFPLTLGEAVPRRNFGTISVRRASNRWDFEGMSCLAGIAVPSVAPAGTPGDHSTTRFLRHSDLWSVRSGRSRENAPS